MSEWVNFLDPAVVTLKGSISVRTISIKNTFIVLYHNDNDKLGHEKSFEQRDISPCPSQGHFPGLVV